MSRPRLAAAPFAFARTLALAATLVGCSSGAWRVEVTLPAGAVTDRVEVRVLSACGSSDVLLRSTVTRGEAATSLGTLPAGTYGVEALAFDATCRVIAEGCVAVTAGGGGGLVRVPTTALATPRACRTDEMCACMAAPADAAVDAACTVCDGDGMCDDLLSSRQHCGGCDRPCNPPMRCMEGMCMR